VNGQSFDTRRNFLRVAAGVGAGLLINGCHSEGKSDDKAVKKDSAKTAGEAKGGEVTATEDLMREHGVLRRALIIYSETAVKLRGNPSAINPQALGQTATLFRAFGEEYHEKKLEEAYIFPPVKRAGGEPGTYADILIAQHQRGREITDYILGMTQGAKLGTSNGDELARALESLVRMYRSHAAREDTIVFPAWKQTLTDDELDEMNDKFEDIEHEQFGEDGFEDAVKQIAGIEQTLGLADLVTFTAPPPPPLQTR